MLLIDSPNSVTWASAEGTVPALLTVQFIPEPGTAALIGLGLALPGFGRRRV